MEVTKCELCGEPMPQGEEMFKYHGYSGGCPKPPMPKTMSGVELIAAERTRQIDVEGWTPEHDDRHTDAVMAIQAAALALDGTDVSVLHPGVEWVRVDRGG
ncbi:MAG TPA: hypothetical protein VM554_15165 [Acidisarcina sp.]|nr:hypothetical protein [Acidisarcina sp.]